MINESRARTIVLARTLIRRHIRLSLDGQRLFSWGSRAGNRSETMRPIIRECSAAWKVRALTNGNYTAE